MGGERETTVEKKESKTGSKADIGGFRIHQSNGEVHVHDDTNKLKVAVPVAAWWKMWDKVRNEPGIWTWLDPDNKSKLTVETLLDQTQFDVRIAVTGIAVNSDWTKINNFTKRK